MDVEGVAVEPRAVTSSIFRAQFLSANTR